MTIQVHTINVTNIHNSDVLKTALKNFIKEHFNDSYISQEVLNDGEYTTDLDYLISNVYSHTDLGEFFEEWFGCSEFKDYGYCLFMVDENHAVISVAYDLA